ncbi:MAG: zf-HC2 domain-containing protein [Oscillospiraceae bacterium]|nr:zf-HC2 domain-containing protein [Oscillospiraceae bacterium]
MKINCNIADDLLPLYLDGVCSSDSRAALEEHLSGCAPCREKLERMRRQDIDPAPQGEDIEIARYARKIKRHRLRAALLIIIIGLIAVCALSLSLLTLQSMHRAANPVVFAVEEGVYNLTAGALETTGAEAEQYVFYTNSAKIKVEISDGAELDGQILLWRTDADEPIQYGGIAAGESECVFTGLTAAARYRLTFPDGADRSVRVSEGRETGFWQNMKSVLSELCG